jgi:hypothetical protein
MDYRKQQRDRVERASEGASERSSSSSSSLPRRDTGRSCSVSSQHPHRMPFSFLCFFGPPPLQPGFFFKGFCNVAKVKIIQKIATKLYFCKREKKQQQQ